MCAAYAAAEGYSIAGRRAPKTKRHLARARVAADRRTLKELHSIRASLDKIWGERQWRRSELSITDSAVRDLAAIYRQVRNGEPLDSSEYVVRLRSWARNHGMPLSSEALAKVMFSEATIRKYSPRQVNTGPMRAAEKAIGILFQVEYRTIHGLRDSHVGVDLAFGENPTLEDVIALPLRVAGVPEDLIPSAIEESSLLALWRASDDPEDFAFEVSDGSIDKDVRFVVDLKGRSPRRGSHPSPSRRR